MDESVRAERVAKQAAWLWTIAYVVAVFGTSAIAAAAGLKGYWASAALLVPMLLLIPLVRAKGRSAVAQGHASPALLTYNRRTTAIMVIFLVAMVTTSALVKEWQPTGMVLVLLALLPAQPMLAMVWSAARYLRDEQDEYLRQRYAKAALIATGVLLSVAAVWGFLEAFAGTPHLPIWAALPIWAMALGFANMSLIETA
jgi:hypothetical protein